VPAEQAPVPPTLGSSQKLSKAQTQESLACAGPTGPNAKANDKRQTAATFIAKTLAV
jgi:hypothetical protein